MGLPINIVRTEIAYVTYSSRNMCRCQNGCNIPADKNILCSSIFWLQGGRKNPRPFSNGPPTALDRKPCCWLSTFILHLSLPSTLSLNSDMFVFSFILHCFSGSFLDFTVFSKDCLINGRGKMRGKKKAGEANPLKTDAAHSQHSKYLKVSSKYK